MKIIFIIFLIIVGYVVLKEPNSEKVRRNPASGEWCLPHFPFEDRWVGGDGVFSVSLRRGKTLWLFGDTFYSKNNTSFSRKIENLTLGTSIGISECNKNNFEISYYFGSWQKEGPTSFFLPKTENNHYWPRDPFVLKGNVYIPLIEIVPIPYDNSVFNFKVESAQIVRLENIHSTTDKWDKVFLQTKIPNICDFGSASFLYGDYVYFYCYMGGLGNTISRIYQKSIIENNKLLEPEYLFKDQSWRRFENKENNINKQNIKIVLPDTPSEFSITYFPEIEKWIAIYIPPVNMNDLSFASDMKEVRERGRPGELKNILIRGDENILMRQASSPLGPWSEPKIIYRLPEKDSSSKQFEPLNFCYAGREQALFRKENKIVLTYVCQNLLFETLVHDLNNYKPVVVELGISLLKSKE